MKQQTCRSLVNIIIDHLTLCTDSWGFHSLISQWSPVKGLLYNTGVSTFIAYNSLSWFLRLGIFPKGKKGEKEADFFPEIVTSLSPSFLILL